MLSDDTRSGRCLHTLAGHEGDINRVVFNPQVRIVSMFLVALWLDHLAVVLSCGKGTCIVTAGADQTARVWDVASGRCLQVLQGHTDEIFSCAFNYTGDTIITGTVLTTSVCQLGAGSKTTHVACGVVPCAVTPSRRQVIRATMRRRTHRTSEIQILAIGACTTRNTTTTRLTIPRLRHGRQNSVGQHQTHQPLST